MFVGLTFANMKMACLDVITNYILLRSWHEETGRGNATYPLIAKAG